jgi:F-type H+-transporting ATPase subunit b
MSHALLAVGPLAEAENPVLPNTTELIIGLICFIVVFGALGWKLLPRIQQTLQERTEAIEGGLKRAEEAQAEAQRTLEQYREQLAGARHEAARLREQASEQGAQIIAEMREEGQRQRDAIVAAGHQQVEADRKSAYEALRRDVGELATQLAGRIVGESLEDEARQRRTVDRFLAELESGPDSAEPVGAGPEQAR